MKQVGRWWVPEVMTSAGSHLSRAEAARVELQRRLGAGRRRVVVQAGGHIGTYPRVLATVFDRVYTFEPERQNFACLVRNTDDLPGVFAARMALGLDRGCRDLFVHQTRTGRHALVDQPGPVPVLRIDDLRLDLCDAIVLDLEGSELAALQGARWTLQHHHPLLIVEENGRHEDYGIAAGAIAALLRTMGYDAGMRHEEDLIFDVARTYACH